MKVRRIEQIEDFGGACYRSVEPAEIVSCQLALMALAFHEHVVPFATLGFVAGNCVAEFEPQSIEIRVCFQRMLKLHAFSFQLRISEAEVEIKSLVLVGR
ncbi:hypothetical protein D3C85_1237230 [compost metagenome]